MGWLIVATHISKYIFNYGALAEFYYIYLAYLRSRMFHKDCSYYSTPLAFAAVPNFPRDQNLSEKQIKIHDLSVFAVSQIRGAKQVRWAAKGSGNGQEPLNCTAFELHRSQHGAFQLHGSAGIFTTEPPAGIPQHKRRRQPYRGGDFASIADSTGGSATIRTVVSAGYPKASSRELTGFFPRIRRIFPSGNIRSNPGKFRLLGPYDITIGRVTRLEDVSVTDSNLKNAAVQLGCKLATHCSVFVQLVTGEIASVQSS